MHHYTSQDDEDEKEPALFTLKFAVATLLISTIIIGIMAEFLVGSLEEISRVWNLSEVFIGLIILPVVGNAAEHVAAVYAALRGKMDLALGVALGSSVQISMFVTPVLVLFK